jgi:hypothetical protein
MNTENFITTLHPFIEPARINKAIKMLKGARFELYTQLNDDELVGVVSSQTDSSLVYSCRLDHAGQFSCCTQNLNACGGLRGKPCKHILVLIIGLVQTDEIDAATALLWMKNTRSVKPKLDKDKMSETLLRYKGVEAGEIDWRPTETTPEDYYLY